jgi:hypothetical protein
MVRLSHKRGPIPGRGIPPFVRLASFNLLVNHENSPHRVAKFDIGSSSDGSIYVHFPGIKNMPGLVTVATHRPTSAEPTIVSLTEQGRVTSHVVKFAHHQSGEAHFSQSGRVRTEIRKPSVPLRAIQGHFMTIQLQGIGAFAPPRKNDRTPAISLPLTGEVQALKIVVHWKTARRLRFEPGSPPYRVRRPDGSVVPAAFVMPPEGTPFDDKVLTVVAEKVPWLSVGQEPTMTMIGGFDPPATMRSRHGDARFLAMMYPCESFDELRVRLGSIDLAT